VSDADEAILEHQADASDHETFEELPERTTEAIEAAVEPPDNRFVPFRAVQLLEVLTKEPTVNASPEDLRAVFDALREVIDQEAVGFERSLATWYHPFWPDADTNRLGDPTDAEEERLLDAVAYLFDKANFERLTDDQLEHAILTANTHGLRVEIDHDAVRYLRVYVRGRGTITKNFRSARAPIRGKPREIEVFKRLAMVISFNEDDHVHFKLFRDIPMADLEALMPHANVKMTWFDRVKVFGGSAGALGGVASKIIGGVALGGALLWALLVALIGFSLKGFFGYRNTMRNRIGQRTQHLYYQNLANNAGVFISMLYHVRDEELKEAFLSYAFLVDQPPTDECSTDARIEAWIKSRFGLRVNFDCEDGFETLDRFDLWEDRSTCRVVTPEVACERLLDHWRERSSTGYHQSMIK
jgi:hypothetical protein